MSQNIKTIRKPTVFAHIDRSILRDESEEKEEQLKEFLNVGQLKEISYTNHDINQEGQNDTYLLAQLSGVDFRDDQEYSSDLDKVIDFFRGYIYNLTLWHEHEDREWTFSVANNWTERDMTYMEDSVGSIERFLEYRRNLTTGEWGKDLPYTVSTTVLTLDGSSKMVHQKLFHSNYKPSIPELCVAVLIAMLILETFVIGPMVSTVNECMYLAAMINKLYHRRKVNIDDKTGVNAVASVKGINPNKSPAQILAAQMGQREKIEMSWFDIFIYKYIRCSCY